MAFDAEPIESATDATVGPSLECAPPSGEAVATLNSSEIRAGAAETNTNGNSAEGGESAGPGDGNKEQKVTPWEVEVRRLSGCFVSLLRLSLKVDSFI